MMAVNIHLEPNGERDGLGRFGAEKQRLHVPPHTIPLFQVLHPEWLCLKLIGSPYNPVQSQSCAFSEFDDTFFCAVALVIML